jgi:hypothetical protein
VVIVVVVQRVAVVGELHRPVGSWAWPLVALRSPRRREWGALSGQRWPRLDDRHSFEVWALWGTAQRSIIHAMSSIVADHADADLLSAQVTRVCEIVNTVRDAGLTVFITLFDGALAQLLTAIGRRAEARAQLGTAITLGRGIEMGFYEAELLRLRAHTHTDARRADLVAALGVARRQGAHLYEFRATLDDFDLRGEPARAALDEVAGRFAADSPLPERQRYLSVTQQARVHSPPSNG